MVLSKGQQEAYNLIASGQNVFLTGEAGTGKSYVVQEFIRQNKKKKKILVCAPTGVSAINIGGTTIHRAFKLPWSGLRPDKKVKTNNVVSSAEIIIIDEISMCRLDVFITIASILKRAKKQKQVIVVGDFFQLPPVLTPKERNFFCELWGDFVLPTYRDFMGEPFAFMTEAWESFGFQTVYLTEQMRQKEDISFLDILNRVRVGDSTALPWVTENTADTPKSKNIYLCGRNDIAYSMNMEELKKIPFPEKQYLAKKDGLVRPGDTLADDILTLKKGCRVMAIVNDQNEGAYVNGSLGTVRELTDKFIVVDFDNGALGVKIYPYLWEIIQYEVIGSGKNRVFEESVCGTVIQLPVKLAYAVTIHKSQGQTFDFVRLNPECFSPGQLYTALSRVRKATDLYLDLPIRSRYLKTSVAVKRFYENLKNKSEK